MPIDNDDADALRNAVKLLEYPSLAARLTNMVGKPVELLGRALPEGASQAIAQATTKSLEAALKVALLTIQSKPQESSQLLHRTLAVASGAVGGAFGIFSLPVELPVSTIIILRSILDIARSEGENLTDPEATLSCVEVLGLGGRTETDDAAKSEDRKSTRLNSSHANISYAVFCLKKKNRPAAPRIFLTGQPRRSAPEFARTPVCVALCSFFFNDTATTEIYTLSLHDALPIWPSGWGSLSATADIRSDPGWLTLCIAWSGSRLRHRRGIVCALSAPLLEQGCTPCCCSLLFRLRRGRTLYGILYRCLLTPCRPSHSHLRQARGQIGRELPYALLRSSSTRRAVTGTSTRARAARLITAPPMASSSSCRPAAWSCCIDDSIVSGTESRKRTTASGSMAAPSAAATAATSKITATVSSRRRVRIAPAFARSCVVSSARGAKKESLSHNIDVSSSRTRTSSPTAFS